MKSYFNIDLDDPKFEMAGHLLALTETICRTYGQPKGYSRFLMWLLEKVADRLIWGQ